MKRKTLYKILLVLLLATFLVSGGMVVQRQIEYTQSAGDYEDAMRIAGLAEHKAEKVKNFTAKATPAPASKTPVPGEEMAAPAPTEPPLVLPKEAEPLTVIDLPALQEVNPEVVGWIDIPGVISFPLLHTGDNEFYLYHSWNNSYNGCGSIFLECLNHPDLSDIYTIIYGHRMDNDSMFGVLRFYQEPGYWQEHPLFYIYDGAAIREYEIFSVFEADVEGFVYRMNRENSEEFFQQCADSSDIDTGIVPEPDTPVVTLSTCPRSGYDSRLVVMGQLLHEYNEYIVD